MLSIVSGCMANMHEAGYVHRDFKPTSIIFQQTSMQFVSVGFSAVERIGGSRPHAFTLGYAAPEVVQFAEEHPGETKALEATTAMDSWSMGVIAIELLTGAPALDVDSFGVESVRFGSAVFLRLCCDACAAASVAVGMLGQLLLRVCCAGVPLLSARCFGV